MLAAAPGDRLKVAGRTVDMLDPASLGVTRFDVQPDLERF